MLADIALGGEPAKLSINAPNPLPAKFLAKHAVLFFEVLGELLLVPR
jgi:hypothetical protein